VSVVPFFYSKIVSIQRTFVFGWSTFFLFKKRNQTAHYCFKRIMGTVPIIKGKVIK